MLIEMIAGPVPSGCTAPDLEGIEPFVRQPKGGEPAVKACCPVCSGAGVLMLRRRGMRHAETCRRCSGSGWVEGVPLVRLVAAPGDAALGVFGLWARDAQLRVDRALRLQEEGGADDDHAGAALVWSDFRGERLRERRSSLVGRQALGIAVEVNGKIDAHVAGHVVTADGRVAIVGLWDVTGGREGGLHAEWSEPGSKAIAARWDVRFPLAALGAALRRAACRGCGHVHFGSGASAAPRGAALRSLPMPTMAAAC